MLLINNNKEMTEETTIEFLARLRAAGVRLTIKDEKLGCTAPKGIVTPALAAEIKDRKPEIMALLSQNFIRQIPPVSRLGLQKYHPSSGQRQLWFLDRINPDSHAYNISFGLRIHGPLDSTALEASFREVIRRHETLRTAIIEDDGEPTAFVRDVAWQLGIRDLSALSEAEREIAMRDILKDERCRRFDLAHPPLLRACLVTMRPEEYVLSICVHHIAADGYSLGILVKELISLYDAFSAGAPSPLPELAVQFSDYAAWRGEHFDRQAFESEASYWKNKLSEPLPVTEMPSDRQRLAQRSPIGSRSLQILPPGMLEKVKQFSQAQNTTPFVTLLSAFYLLLFRYTRQTDLIVGSASAGRGQGEVEGLIGLFIRNLVLRITLKEQSLVRDLIECTRDTVLGASSNENLTLERIVEMVQPQRDMTRAPLFQTMFVFQHRIEGLPAFAGTRSAPVNSAGGKVILDDDAIEVHSRYDLTVEATEAADNLLLQWEYSADLFDQPAMERFQRHYRNLLEGMIADPAQPISAVPLLDAEERARLASAAAVGGEYSTDLCVHDWFARQCALTPDATAVTFEGTSLTYRELRLRQQNLARLLTSMGVGPETLVGVFLDRSIDLLVAQLAVLQSGGAYIPLDPAYPPDRLAFMLEDSRAAVVITETPLVASVPPSGPATICIDELPPFDEAAAPARLAGPENCAYVIYTSGSTGKPKGVQVLHRSLTNFLASMQREPGLTPSDNLLAVTTSSFDISGLELYLPLVTGARLVIASKDAAANGEALSRMIKEERITAMQATPITWRLLLEAGWQGTPGLKILCGGEALDRELANRLVTAGSSVWNLYGPTETTIWSALHRVEGGEGAVPIGRPVANTQLYILDERLQPVPEMATGEMYIGGDGVARGYLNRPDLTEAKFLENPFVPGGRMYRTGDFARLLPHGVIEYLGRADGQIKLRGYRIELGEVEAVLQRQRGVKQAVVIVREDAPGDQRLTAYIVADDREHLTAEGLREALQETLPDYMAPAAYVFMRELPLTPNRKVDKKALPAPDASVSRSAKFVAPRTESERQVAAIWQTLLQNQNVGVTENFFDLGGHSLMVIRLQARLRKQFGWQPSLIDLFQHPTVASIARLIDQQAAENRLVAAVGGN